MCQLEFKEDKLSQTLRGGGEKGLGAPCTWAIGTGTECAENLRCQRDGMFTTKGKCVPKGEGLMAAAKRGVDMGRRGVAKGLKKLPGKGTGAQDWAGKGVGINFFINGGTTVDDVTDKTNDHVDMAGKKEKAQSIWQEKTLRILKLETTFHPYNMKHDYLSGGIQKIKDRAMREANVKRVQTKFVCYLLGPEETINNLQQIVDAIKVKLLKHNQFWVPKKCFLYNQEKYKNNPLEDQDQKPHGHFMNESKGCPLPMEVLLTDRELDTCEGPPLKCYYPRLVTDKGFPDMPKPQNNRDLGFMIRDLPQEGKNTPTENEKSWRTLHSPVDSLV